MPQTSEYKKPNKGLKKSSSLICGSGGTSQLENINRWSTVTPVFPSWPDHIKQKLDLKSLKRPPVLKIFNIY